MIVKLYQEKQLSLSPPPLPLPTKCTHIHAPLPLTPSSASHPSHSLRLKPGGKASLQRPVTPKWLSDSLPEHFQLFGCSLVSLGLQCSCWLNLTSLRYCPEKACGKIKSVWGLPTCFKVSNFTKALGEASALSVDGFICMYLFNEGGKRHQ